MYYRSNLHAGIRAFGTNRLIGNIVVGSTGAAYRVPPATTGATCSGTICYDDETSNVAVASSMGWVLFPTDSVLHNGVNFVSGFKFWKIAHMAVYYNSKNSVQFSCLFFADNGLDIFPMVYGPSAIEHKVEGKFVTVCDSMMIGYSSTMDCDRDTIPTGDYMNFYRSCSAPKGEDDSKYSVIFAQFIQEINYAHYNKETCTGFTKYMSLRGHMEVKGVYYLLSSFYLIVSWQQYCIFRSMLYPGYNSFSNSSLFEY